MLKLFQVIDLIDFDIMAGEALGREYLALEQSDWEWDHSYVFEDIPHRLTIVESSLIGSIHAERVPARVVLVLLNQRGQLITNNVIIKT